MHRGAPSRLPSIQRNAFLSVRRPGADVRGRLTSFSIADIRQRTTSPGNPRQSLLSRYQDARQVQTKFSKTFTTFFFPVGDGVRKIVVEWLNYRRESQLWGNEDPLFPATRVQLYAQRQFEAAGLARTHWSNAAPIREIFRRAFSEAGLPYFKSTQLQKYSCSSRRGHL
jgi:hypothetical protein